jgi:hypothetical protein
VVKTDGKAFLAAALHALALLAGLVGVLIGVAALEGG